MWDVHVVSVLVLMERGRHSSKVQKRKENRGERDGGVV